ncbi:MAG: DPP IV N-terminal domain-containing protein [Fimbriimonadaceae bacterium]|nr:DPP IV N-terminal domain-containing protein [Fimbriimonadaceae bacterium]
MKHTFVLVGICALASSAVAQGRLGSYPGHDVATRIRPQVNRLANLPRVNGTWTSANTFVFNTPDGWRKWDASSNRVTTSEAPQSGGGGNRQGVGRGRQFTEATAADGTKATYRDGNLYLQTGESEKALTTEGNELKGIKFGSASWVYGEELGQNQAFGFSPDSRYLWYYRFDESQVPIYYLAVNQRQPHSTLYPERYPKPGDPNPMVDLFIYDRQSGRSTSVKVRPGAFDNGVGHYIFNLEWLSDGRLAFRRADRRQTVLEYCAANPQSGEVQVLVRDENPNGWCEGDFPIVHLDDGTFLWISERSGYANYEQIRLRDGDRKVLTNHKFEVRQVVLNTQDTLFYMALGGRVSASPQLFARDWASGEIRQLTDSAYANRVSPAPDGKHFAVTFEAADKAPQSLIIDGQGKEVIRLVKNDEPDFGSAGYRAVMPFTFMAADGTTQLNGVLHYPYQFDPTKKYPVIASVYGGPLGAFSTGFNNAFRTPNSLCDYGFFVVEVENRGTQGRGRAFKDAMYRNMNVTVDDIAAGVKSLSRFPGVDLGRVGIEGTSYGGYTSLLGLLRYPDVFHAAVSSSCVSDWRNYDTTYTERYMDLLENNEAGYNRTGAVPYADQLRGALLIYYGTSDDNTHPTNTLQVIAALQGAGKTFEVQVGPDRGHSAVDRRRMIEFFIEHLIMGRPGAVATP